MGDLAGVAQAGAQEIVVGQGVSDYEIESLTSALDDLPASDRPELRAEAPALATRLESHKRRASNVLVADIQAVSDLSCAASLRIHGDNELLIDHQSGQHVQGMVAVEAARQMFLASTARLGLASGLEKPYYVINSMTTRFQSFLFPLPGVIRYRTSPPDRSRADSARFEATIEIDQNSTLVSTTEVDFSVFAGERISEIESRKARKALETVAPAPDEALARV
jgi:hypothetical protein